MNIFSLKFLQVKVNLKNINRVVFKQLRKDEKLFFNDQNLSQSSQFIYGITEAKFKRYVQIHLQS